MQHEIYLKDEIPKFHSGWRTITVLKSGPAWVTLQCGRKRARVRRSVWVNLITTAARSRNRNSQR